MTPGVYSALLGGSGLGGGQTEYLIPGDYVVDNGAAGGADVGPFQATRSLVSPVVWTNRDDINSIPTGQPLTVTWDGGPGEGFVHVVGSSFATSSEVGAAFMCKEHVSAKQFTVPAAVIDALPPSQFDEGIPSGTLSLVTCLPPTPFTATGLDVGKFTNADGTMKTVSYHSDAPPGPATFTLSSSAFTEGALIPQVHSGCNAPNTSPALEWSGEPAGTQSFVLIMDDPDAPTRIFTHWLLWDIPANVHALPEGFTPQQWGVSGANDGAQIGYFGPCPPPGPAHHYVFRLYAIDAATLGLPAGSQRVAVDAALFGHVLGQAEYVGTYAR